ncbi:AcrR family transcriptional regulator [Kitasatospora sp. GP82]|nr:AcrR family transcriptional regulator [Kitasatospora sp. GP82]
MREIAAEAGVSLRVVQYHFTGKHQLLVAALQMLHEENELRARSRIQALHSPVEPRALLRAVLEEFLPLDEQRHMALRVFAAYYARSLTDPAIAKVFLHDAWPAERLLAALIEQAQQDGSAPTGARGRPAVTLMSPDVLHRSGAERGGGGRDGWGQFLTARRMTNFGSLVTTWQLPKRRRSLRW